jgi:hypothetical protein
VRPTGLPLESAPGKTVLYTRIPAPSSTELSRRASSNPVLTRVKMRGFSSRIRRPSSSDSFFFSRLALSFRVLQGFSEPTGAYSFAPSSSASSPASLVCPRRPFLPAWILPENRARSAPCSRVDPEPFSPMGARALGGLSETSPNARAPGPRVSSSGVLKTDAAAPV